MNRDKMIQIKWVTENVIPAVLRDNRYFAKFLYFIALGEKGKYYIDYYENFLKMTPMQVSEIYERIYEKGHPSGCVTDLNKKCLERIRIDIVGDKIMDVGCGNAFLINDLMQLYPNFKFSGCDFVERKPEKLEGSVAYSTVNLEHSLPFDDNSFDTVICTHVLEHILNFQQLLSELRRIASKKLIVVVPKERPYKYNFGMHIHFFPYKEAFLYTVGKRDNQSIMDLGGDLYYVENNL